MKYGLRYEKDFCESLAAMGCEINATGTMDYEEMTDFTVSRVDAMPFRPPVRVQVTLRVGNSRKLQGFSSARAHDIGASVYVEIDDRCTPDQAALELKRVLLNFIDHPISLRGCHRLSVGRNGSSFTAVRNVPAIAERRPAQLCGLVVKRLREGFDILSERGGIYFAFPADIADKALRQELLRRQRNRRLVQRIRVSFEPDDSNGKHSARAVRALNE